MIAPLSSLLAWPEGQAPYAKQEEAFALGAEREAFALLMQQRTGKTPVTLGTFAHHYSIFQSAGGFGGSIDVPGKVPPSPIPGRLKPSVEPPKLPPRFVVGDGKRAGRFSDLPKDAAREMIYRPASWAASGVDAMLVVAMPSGLPANWQRECDLRLPASMNHRSIVWDSGKSDGAAYAAAFRDLLGHPGAVSLFVNGEALRSADCRKAIGAFLRTRRALVVADETSLLMSDPTNFRARVMEAIKKLPGCILRRILDGTPVDESPFDAYAPFHWLDPRILGFTTFTAFKSRHGKYETQLIWIKNRATGKPEERPIPKRIGYENVDELSMKMGKAAFVVERKDVFDVPAKLYQPYEFDLSAAQRAVYDPLKEEFEADVRGDKVKAAHVLARMVRLDQVRAGYWPSEKVSVICENCLGEGCENCGDVGATIEPTPKKIIVAPKDNPLILAFSEVLSINRDPGIVWAVFDETCDALVDAARAAGRRAVRYDGTVKDAAKEAALADFQGGRADLIVSKESSLGRGLDGRAAGWMAYVENGYSNRKRAQSEDRAEVAGRKKGTAIIDLTARDTADQDKAAARKMKVSVASYVMQRIKGARR